MKNYIGEKYGKLTILEFMYKKNSHYYYKCKCDCGNEKIIALASLRNGNTKSCGCYHKEVCIKKFKKDHNDLSYISRKRLHTIWNHMKYRCYSKKCSNYKNYGGRNIKICDEWKDFNNFYNWALKNGYQNNLSIDRIDNDKNYEPKNCRWITIQEQQKNRRNNVIIRHNNKVYTIKDLADLYGIKNELLH